MKNKLIYIIVLILLLFFLFIIYDTNYSEFIILINKFVDINSPFYFSWKESLGKVGYGFISIFFNIPICLLQNILGIGLEVNIIYKVIYLFLGIIFHYFLINKIFGQFGKNKVYFILGAILYSLYVSILSSGYELIQISYWIIPLCLFIFLKLIDYILQNKIKGVYVFLGYLLSIFILLNLIILEQRLSISFNILLIFVSTVYLYNKGMLIKKNILKLIFFYLISIIGFLILFFSYLKLMKYEKENSLSFPSYESVELSRNYIDNLFFNLNSEYHLSLFGIIFSVILFCFFIYTFIKSKKKKLFLIIILFLFFILFINSNWFRLELSLNIPFGQLFRNWRIAQYLMGFEVSLIAVYIFLFGTKKVKYLLSTLIIIYSFYSLYTYSSKLHYFKLSDIKPYYSADNFIVKNGGNNHNYKGLSIPEMGWFGSNHSPFWLKGSSGQGFPERFFNYNTYWHYYNYMTHVYTWLASAIWRSQTKTNLNIDKLFNILGLKYLVIHNDIPGYKKGTEQIIDNFRQNKNLKQVYSTGYIQVWENKSFKSRFWLVDKRNSYWCDWGLDCINKFYDNKQVNSYNSELFLTDRYINSKVFNNLKNNIEKIYTIGKKEKYYLNLLTQNLSSLEDEGNKKIKFLWARDFAKYMKIGACLNDTHHGVYHTMFRPSLNYDFSNSFKYGKCFFLLTKNGYQKDIKIPINIKKGKYKILIRYFKHINGGKFDIHIGNKNIELNGKGGNYGFYDYEIRDLNVDNEINNMLFENISGNNIINFIGLINSNLYYSIKKEIKNKFYVVSNIDIFTGDIGKVKKIKRINPTYWKIDVKAKNSFILNFAETYDKNWKIDIYIDGKKIDSVYSVPGYSMINSFIINQTGDLQIDLKFELQEKFERNLIIGIILSLFIIILGSWFIVKINNRKE